MKYVDRRWYRRPKIKSKKSDEKSHKSTRRSRHHRSRRSISESDDECSNSDVENFDENGDSSGSKISPSSSTHRQLKKSYQVKKEKKRTKHKKHRDGSLANPKNSVHDSQNSNIFPEISPPTSPTLIQNNKKHSQRDSRKKDANEEPENISKTEYSLKNSDKDQLEIPNLLDLNAIFSGEQTNIENSNSVTKDED